MPGAMCELPATRASRRVLAGDFAPGDTIKANYAGKTFTFARTGPAKEVEAGLVEGA